MRQTIYFVILLASLLCISACRKEATVRPGILSVRSSSNLSDYPVSNIWDGRLSTTWVGKSTTDGIGDWVQFDLDDRYFVESVDISPGFDAIKNGRDLFTANNSLKRATLSFSEGNYQRIEFDGDTRSYQIPVKVSTTFVRITVDEVYQGVRWRDTCISEMQLNVKPR